MKNRYNNLPVELLEEYIEDVRVLQMKNFIQHGDVDTYEHCVDVARKCIKVAERMPFTVNARALGLGALLHDYYLYDWHDGRPERRIHGFTHPEAARKMAVRDFDIGVHEQNIIRSHMWPLTLTKIPTSREAWILCFVDKYCSGIETVAGRVQKCRQKTAK